MGRGPFTTVSSIVTSVTLSMNFTEGATLSKMIWKTTGPATQWLGQLTQNTPCMSLSPLTNPGITPVLTGEQTQGPEKQGHLLQVIHEDVTVPGFRRRPKIQTLTMLLSAHFSSETHPLC